MSYQEPPGLVGIALVAVAVFGAVVAVVVLIWERLHRKRA